MTCEIHAVLYVEDEATDAFLLQRAFGKLQLESAFHTVSHGQAAIDYLSSKGAYSDRTRFPLPAVVLLDLNLPEIHGFEVLQWIRSHPEHKELPVVIFSSSAREEDQATARELGANDYWQKPNSAGEFRVITERLRDGWLMPVLNRAS